MSWSRLKFESRVALLFGGIFGLLALWFVPPVVQFDAPGHYFRTVQIQRGEWRAERYSPQGLGGVIQARYAIFVDRLWGQYWNAHDFGTHASWRELSNEAETARDRRRIEFTNIAGYSPVNHAFPAIGFGLAAWFTRSPLTAHTAGCAANLAGYLLLVVFAVELAPRAERLIVLFATCPLMLIQAASLSADPINFALPLLLLALVWRLRDQPAAATPRSLATILALGLAVAALKPTAIAFLVCVAFLPLSGFGSRGRQLITLSLFGAGVLAVWFTWNRPYFDLEMAQWFEPGHPPAGEMKAWFLRQPWTFLPVLGRAVVVNLWEQWPQFYGGVGGWIDQQWQPLMHGLSIVFFVAGAGCILGARTRSPVDRIWAVAMALQSIALFALMSLVFWLTYGTIGARVVPGMGGRYFYPVYLGLFLAARELGTTLPTKLGALAWTVALGANALALEVILVTTALRTW